MTNCQRYCAKGCKIRGIYYDFFHCLENILQKDTFLQEYIKLRTRFIEFQRDVFSVCVLGTIVKRKKHMAFIKRKSYAKVGSFTVGTSVS